MLPFAPPGKKIFLFYIYDLFTWGKNLQTVHYSLLFYIYIAEQGDTRGIIAGFQLLDLGCQETVCLLQLLHSLRHAPELLYVCVYVCMCVYMYSHTHTRTHAHTHTHTHTHSKLSRLM